MGQRPANWAGNVTFHVEHVHRPSSLEQLQKLVARADRIRVLGSGHSFNSIADTDGELISLAGMPEDVTVNADGTSVTVGAAMPYGEVSQRLHAEGYALHNLGSLPHISVAGSCATATHGSGVTNGNLATAVSAIDLVTGDGEMVTLTAQDDAFPGAVVGLGALGAVVNVTLTVEPAYDVEQYVFEDLPHEALTEHFDTIVSAAYSVSLFTRWRSQKFDQVWVKHRADRGPWTAREEWFGARMARAARHPVPGMSPEHCTEQAGQRGPWHERLPHFRLGFTPSSGEELQSEYFVPRSRAVEAIHALDRIRDVIAPVLQISEIRTIAADDLWLSPAYQKDVVAVHFTWIDDPRAVHTVLPVIEDALDPFDPVPHWGKVFTMPAQRLRPRYPRLPDFRELVNRYDPDRKFRNDFTDRYLFDAS
ncbi:FAD-binding protein [Actinobacteria bacterium YIM 96077]|uniref:FAD-binding protein n=1 Tax=Phytoactinopolyspora halophila TaxID=1981511 RepID=A0A329QTW3_9ACTN|nr:FAD-binding protein [Phytoactinopolyspora halophila]AYY15079.1 FAD-binding protein [Actinobacteria bacterium YIM 96077]RAW14158.1 FAD-binding protein [Phytoactinopolyspora halophila]